MNTSNRLKDAIESSVHGIRALTTERMSTQLHGELSWLEAQGNWLRLLHCVCWELLFEWIIFIESNWMPFMNVGLKRKRRRSELQIGFLSYVKEGLPRLPSWERSPLRVQPIQFASESSYQMVATSTANFWHLTPFRSSPAPQSLSLTSTYKVACNPL